MFISADRQVALPFETAADALERAMSDGGLVSESRRAISDGLEFVMPVGPRGSHFPSREVIVHMLPARRSDGRMVVALRWETTGPTGRLFPALDADLQLEEGEDAGSSKLSIIGRYQAPLGPFGETLDRVVMFKVASATMTAMLREVATRLEYWVS